MRQDGHRWRIETLEDLIFAADNGFAIEVDDSPVWKHPKPAAFVIGLQGSLIRSMIVKGMYIHKKEKRGKL